MDDRDSSTIPTRLDDPPKFMWWDFDVAMLFMSFFVFGLVTGWILSFSIVGILFAWLYRKSKAGQHRAYGMHLIYWHLPVNLGMKATPPSSIREYIG
ncbi:MAG: type IV conjugative transfer system protein TraL [Thiobacillus sp. 65-69]|jgi:conjugal transfer pilus assembly protein TraL|nr:MAG: type IV conjugative transfer system protein TraL [Thiobacillus sp. SCN 65-179]OJW37781.1 MAG: type IV conjugative transfer system protein TraL [Thiobacillus sp. 65-69]